MAPHNETGSLALRPIRPAQPIAGERACRLAGRRSTRGLCSILGAIVVAAAPAFVRAAPPDSSPAPERVAAALRNLQDWLGEGPNAAAWDKYLRHAALEEMLADPSEASAAQVGRAAARYYADVPGLSAEPFREVRDALDAWQRELKQSASADGELADLVAAAEGDFRTVSRREFDAAREELRQRAADLDRALGSGSANAAQWQEYLKWPLVAPHLAGADLPEANEVRKLAEVSERLYANHPGLELKPFRRVRAALEKYRTAAAWHLAGKERDPADDYAQLIAGMGSQLERLDQRRSSNPPWLAARVLAVVDDIGASPELVAAVRKKFAQPNIYAVVSDDFVNRIPRPPVDTVRPVRQTILGTRIYGQSHTLGSVRLQPMPWNDAIALVAQFQGNAHARTNGYNGPVKIRSTSTTALAAVKRIHFSDAGFVVGGAVSDADTRSQIHSINKTGGQFAHKLIEKIAWKRAGEQKRQSENIGAGNAANQLRENLDVELAAAVADGRARYEEKVRGPLVRQGFDPRAIHMASTARDLQVVATLARRNQLAADALPPPAVVQRDLSARLHESAVDNYLAAALGNVTLSQDAADAPLKITGAAPPWLKKAATKKPPATPTQAPDYDAEHAPAERPAAPPFKPWSMTLNAEAPVAVTFDDGELVIRLRAAVLASEEDEYRNWDIIVRYRVERRGNRIVLVRTGPIEALPTTFDPAWDKRMSGRDSAFRNTLAKNMTARAEAGQGFPSEIDIPPIRIEGLGELTLADLACDDHWLALGWLLP